MDLFMSLKRRRKDAFRGMKEFAASWIFVPRDHFSYFLSSPPEETPASIRRWTIGYDSEAARLSNVGRARDRRRGNRIRSPLLLSVVGMPCTRLGLVAAPVASHAPTSEASPFRCGWRRRPNSRLHRSEAPWPWRCRWDRLQECWCRGRPDRPACRLRGCPHRPR